MSRTIPSPIAGDCESETSRRIAVSEQALDSIGERRYAPRTDRRVLATLRTLAGAEISACPADNLSEGGLRLTVPVGFGLAVGQRYEVLLRADGTDGDTADMVGDGHYATVVRTEIVLAQDGEGDRVGVGLRFDTPLML